MPDLSLGFPFPDLMRHQHFKISILFFFTFFSERAHLQELKCFTVYIKCCKNLHYSEVLLSLFQFRCVLCHIYIWLHWTILLSVRISIMCFLNMYWWVPLIESGLSIQKTCSQGGTASSLSGFRSTLASPTVTQQSKQTLEFIKNQQFRKLDRHLWDFKCVNSWSVTPQLHPHLIVIAGLNSRNGESHWATGNGSLKSPLAAVILIEPFQRLIVSSQSLMRSSNDF